MNKTDLINAVAKEAGLTKINSKKVLNVFLTTISNELKKGGKITLAGHGTYQVIDKSAKKGINPRTKATIMIPAKKVVKFKPGVYLI